ncbi:MAG: YeaH/YhbH family protein [Holophaga sp.]|jgi:hypothetical protein
MIRIVDRRFDSKNKSSVNRGRFIKRFKGQIKKAVSDAIDKSGIRDIAEGKKIGIPARDIAEPQFATGPGGIREQVFPGNDRFITGETFDRPSGEGGGRGSKASPDGHGYDDFVFTLTRDEFLDIFFEELALPNLLKRHLASITEFKRVRAGYTQTGVPTNINLVRTMRGAAGRRIAVGGAHLARLRELEAELAQLVEAGQDGGPEARRLRQEILRLRTRVEAVPFIDSFDLRFNNHVRIAQPTTQAVMFCLMDISGSMDEQKKNIAKRFFTLLYLFLTRTYDHIDVVFIRHHTVAEEVDEENFFHSRETGGTVVSSALKLMQKVIESRYNTSLWNIYGAQASDGDNWLEDSVLCYELLSDRILGLTQFYAYIEIAEDTPQNLWEEYEKVQAVHPGVFAMRRIRAVNDIYPVFHDLFKKRT